MFLYSIWKSFVGEIEILEILTHWALIEPQDGKEILLRNWHLNDEESRWGTCRAICANCKDFPGSADQTRRAVISPPRMGVGETPLERSLS